MKPNEFTVLVLEKEADLERLASMTGLADKGLSAGGVEKAIECLAGQNVLISRFVDESARITKACCLHWNGLSFEKVDFVDQQDEGRLLEALNEFFIERDGQKILTETEATMNTLCRRALFHARSFKALFRLDVLDVSTHILRLSYSDEQGLACWRAALDIGHHVSEEDQMVSEMDLQKLLQQPPSISARVFHVCFLFLRYWLASGKISKVKYHSLLRALKAPNTIE